MIRKLATIALLLVALCASTWAEQTDTARASRDSLKAAIDAEAAQDGFIRASLLTMTEGPGVLSRYGHTALRLECPSKGLDYCFSFEMDMRTSSNVDIFTRKAKAAFFAEPTKKFLAQYVKEGRGVTAYELNLTPKQKQTLWRVLDTEAAKGSVWTFDYTTVNCTSMVFYALCEALAPDRLDFGTLPTEVTGRLTDWEDHVSRRSPWVRIVVRTALFSVDETTVHREDLLSPEMLATVLPQARVIAADGQRPLVKGQPVTLMRQTYIDEPLWLRPWMAAALLAIVVVGGTIVIRKRRNSIGKQDN